MTYEDVTPQTRIAEKGRCKTIIEGYRRTEIYTKRYDPGDNLEDHLTFALKFEGKNYHKNDGVKQSSP